MSDPTNITGVGSTITTVSSKKCFSLKKKIIILLDHGLVKSVSFITQTDILDINMGISSIEDYIIIIMMYIHAMTDR